MDDKARIAQLEAQLEALRIEFSHTVDDIERARTKLVREVTAALDLLDVLPHALQHGRYEVIRDHLERVMVDHLQPALAAQPHR